MRIVDHSHPIQGDMPMFPGTPQPIFREEFNVAEHGFAEMWMGTYTHVGTHIDAPAHMVDGGPTLDQLPIESFVGPALVLDMRDCDPIGIAQLNPYRERIARVDFLLLCTGWDRYWGRDDYFTGFPALDSTAATWLAEQPLKGIGVDACSVDQASVDSFPIHRQLLSKGKLLIENLKNLTPLVGLSGEFSCLPLPIVNTDGSPVRAITKIE
jgi:kynurenine formamidase